MKIKCPACENVLQIDASMAGQVTDCICGKKLRVPQIPDSNLFNKEGDAESARQRPGGQGDAASGPGSVPHYPSNGTENYETENSDASAPSNENPYGANPYGQQQDAPQNPYSSAGVTGLSPEGVGQGSNQGLAIASLVLGICSIAFTFACCGGFLFAIPAVVCGVMGIKQANRGQASGKGMAIAGVVMGGIVLALTVILILFYIGMVFFAMQNPGGGGAAPFNF
ncbi:MAG: DUF4190 domain-containing protein [Rubripirellula sp.]|nr:DUF4190 domain-containing protein [Rubripirellula sp.]